MSVNDAPIKTMTEYHQRYSKGRLIHLGWEAYCRDCGRRASLDIITYAQAEEMLLVMGWRREEYKYDNTESWHCPICRSLFPEEALDVNTAD